MIEFVLCVPVIGFFLALTFFFGWSMLNQQNVKAATRHTAWRQIQGAAGSMSALEANKEFFNDSANDNAITFDYEKGTDDTLRAYVDQVSQANQPAGTLAQKAALDNWTHGLVVRVAAQFPSTVGLWQQFQGSIAANRGREGFEWRRGQADIMHPLTDAFLSDLDATLENMPGSGRPLGLMVRSIYLSQW